MWYCSSGGGAATMGIKSQMWDTQLYQPKQLLRGIKRNTAQLIGIANLARIFTSHADIGRYIGKHFVFLKETWNVLSGI